MIDVNEITPGYYWAAPKDEPNELIPVKIEEDPRLDVGIRRLIVWFMGWDISDDLEWFLSRHTLVESFEPPKIKD